MKVDQKVFAITGGARGLGAGMASHLVDLGAHVAIIDLDAAAVEDMKQVLISQAEQANKNITIKGYVCDISIESEVEDSFAQIRQDFGQLNGLINNAGLMRDGMLIKVKDGKLTDKMSLKQWQSVVDVNLTGCFLCGREAAGIMAEQADAGVIINISSVSRAG
ncbi:3-oxoacyl-ACP reductase, partial [Marinomonas sp. 42_23_T18]